MSFEPGKCFTPNPSNSNVMFTLGGKYTSRNGKVWTCIARNREFAWLRNITTPSGPAFVWKSNGKRVSLNNGYDIVPEPVVETGEKFTAEPKPPVLAKDMTLRDYFAVQALAGISADKNATDSMSRGAMAKWAYRQADAMLEERDASND